MHNVTVTLDVREDREKNLYHLGRLRIPGGYLDCNEGMAFLIFLSEEGQEELQLAPLDNDQTTFSQFTRRHDRITLPLSPRVDQFGKKFYVAKFQMNGIFDFRQGATFMVFTAKEGKEELQIVAPILASNQFRRDLDGYQRPAASSSGMHEIDIVRHRRPASSDRDR